MSFGQVLYLHSTQRIASTGQANDQTNTDEDGRGEGEGGPNICHDPDEGEHEPNEREGYTEAFTSDQHVMSVLQLWFGDGPRRRSRS